MENREKFGDSNLYKGIFCIVFSAFCFAMMGMLVHLAGDIPFMQKAFFRNFVAFFIALVILIKQKFVNHVEINAPKKSVPFLFLRSLTGCLGIFGNFYALDHIPIADAGILNKMSPFFAVIFSFLLLGEKIRLVPFLCILGAFFGAIFVVKPSANLMNSFPAIFAFIGGMGAGFAYACVRKLSSMKVTSAVIVLFFSLFSCLICIPFLCINFVPMTLKQWIILILTGVAASGGQFGITTAYYYAPARQISIYDYSQVIFSAILGFIAFGQIPDVFSFVGYVIIILMALFVFLYNRENHSNL